MRLKILVFFLAAAFLAGTFLAAYWYYANIDRPQQRVEASLKRKEKQVQEGNAPDPGAGLFSKAVALLRENKVAEAREQLLRLTRVYRDSGKFVDARRILGEIHMDQLFSRNPMPGKHDYTVKSGDSLLRIEKGSLTTIPFLARLNNLSGSPLQPGDRLIYQPLEFEMEIVLPENRLTLLQKVPGGKTFDFFKDFRVTSVNLPPGTPRGLKTQIHEKAAFVGEKKVLPTDPRYPLARKWLQTTGRGGRIGVLIRPQSERDAQKEVPRESGEEDLTYGIFLADGDMEELNTVIRRGTPVTLQQ